MVDTVINIVRMNLNNSYDIIYKKYKLNVKLIDFLLAFFKKIKKYY